MLSKKLFNTAIEESELMAESEEDESFLDEATGLLENVTAHGDKTEGPGQAVSDGSESDQTEKETDQNVTVNENMVKFLNFQYPKRWLSKKRL